MSLDFIRGINTLLIAFLSYIITMTFAGWFESLVAKKVGDDTPEQLGFLSLNPLDHFNVFGFAAFLWSIFYGSLLPYLQIIPGWGRYITLSPNTMRGKNLKLRGFVEFIGRSIGHLVLVVVSMTIILAMCKGSNYDWFAFVTDLEKGPSLTLVLVKLLGFVYDQNLILFIFHFVVGLCNYVFHFHVPRLQDVSMDKIIAGFLLVILGVIILEPILRIFVAILIKLIQLTLFEIGS